MSRPMNAMKRTPPTTPPAVAPTLVDEDLGEEDKPLSVSFVLSGFSGDRCMWDVSCPVL